MSEINEGINISGGVFHADQIAVGCGAHAIQNTYNIADQLQVAGKEKVAEAITELLKVMEANSNIISDKEDVFQAVQQIAEETQKEQPNRLTLKGLLSSVKESVGTVAEIAEKISAVKKAIALTMGLTAL